MISENHPILAIFLYIIPVSWYITQGFMDWRRAEQKQANRSNRVKKQTS